MTIQRNDRDDHAELREMAAVADDHLLDDLVSGAGVDADPSHRHRFPATGARFIDFEDISALQQERIFNA